MIEKTIEQLLNEEGLTVTKMAAKLGCSIAMVSKIKNGSTVITDDFQRLFQRAYPNYRLVGGKDNWREKYLDLEKKFLEISEMYMCQCLMIQQLKGCATQILDTKYNEKDFRNKYYIKKRKIRRRK